MERKLNSMRRKITQLFEKIGDKYERRNLASSNIYQNNHVHAFYRLIKNPDKVIHIQGYPGESTKKEAKIWARTMNYSKMMLIRRAEGVSVGSEHEATIEIFQNFENNAIIPYKTKILEEMIKQNIPEFSFNKH